MRYFGYRLSLVAFFLFAFSVITRDSVLRKLRIISRKKVGKLFQISSFFQKCQFLVRSAFSKKKNKAEPKLNVAVSFLCFFGPFCISVPYLFLLKTSDKQRFSDVFWDIGKQGTLTWKSRSS